MLYTCGGQQVLKSAKSHFYSVNHSMLQFCEKLQHLTELGISHITFRDDYAEGRSPDKSPTFTDKPEFISDIFSQKRHVMTQIELGGRENDGIAQHGSPTNSIKLTSAERSNGAVWSSFETKSATFPH